MKKTKKKYNLLIAVLICIIVILLICCIVLFMKNEYLDEKYDDVPYKVEDKNKDNYIPNNNDNDNYITKEDAINIALKDINVSKNDVYDLEVELENKYNATVYEVNFDYNYLDYEYYIDAKDGSILKSFSERD